MLLLYVFPTIAVTNYQQLDSLLHHNPVIFSSGGQKREMGITWTKLRRWWAEHPPGAPGEEAPKAACSAWLAAPSSTFKVLHSCLYVASSSVCWGGGSAC